MSSRAIARRMNCHHSTIVRLNERYGTTGSARDRLRSGQPRVTTPAQDRHIVLSHLRNRSLPASQTARAIVGRRGQVSRMTDIVSSACNGQSNMSDGLDCSGMLSYSQTRADSTYPLLMDVCGFGDGVESALQIAVFISTTDLEVTVFTFGEDSVFTIACLLTSSVEMLML